MKKILNLSNFKLYLSIVILFLAVIFFINVSILIFIHSIRNEEQSNQIVNINEAQRQFIDLMTDINSTVQLLDKESKLNSIANLHSYEESTKYSSLSFSNHLQQKLAIYSVYGYHPSIFFSDEDVLLSGNGKCGSLADTYNILYRYGDLDYEQLTNRSHAYNYRYEFFPMNEHLIDKKPYSGVLYLSKLSSFKNTLVITIIDQAQLSQILFPIVQKGGSAFLVDEKNQLLYQYGSALPYEYEKLPNNREPLFLEPLKNDSYLTSHVALINGLHIILSNPNNVVYKNSIRLEHNLFMVNLLVVILTISILTWLILSSKKNLKNTMKLIKVTNRSNNEGNIYQKIDTAVLKLVNEKNNLTDRVHKQSKVLVESFWDSILNNKLQGEDQIIHMAELAGINTNINNYCLLYITLGMNSFLWENPDTELMYTYFDNLYQELIFDELLMDWIHKIGQIQLVLIIPLANVESYKEYVCDVLKSHMDTITNQPFQIVTSKPFCGLKNAYQIYSVCSGINRPFCNNSEVIIWEEDYQMLNKNENFYFPEELMNHMIQGVYAGNYGLITDSLLNVVNKNFEQHQLSNVSIDIFKTKLKLIIASVYQKKMTFLLDQVLNEINSSATVTLLLSHTLIIFQKICSFYNTNTENVCPSIQERIVNYIQDEFSNPNLSLKIMSEHFGYSESYFSKIIKDILGEKFSTYLEETRMKYADKLLLDTEMRVEDIALKVSYNNPNSFCRAYKRYMGIPPSKRRNTRR